MVRRALAPFFGLQSTERDAAWQRADVLLRDSLTPEQYASYDKRGYLEVPSGLHSGRTYRIDGWRPVTVFENGQFIGAVCIRPREQLPAPDVVLARKLMIEGAEQEFLRAGNWLSPAWRPASAAPSLLLMLVLLTPWLAHLIRFGYAGLALALALLVTPLIFVVRRRRSERRASG